MSTPAAAPKIFEEGDEFEDFIAEDWKEDEMQGDDEMLWEDDWDDDDLEDDFSQQLRQELTKAAK